MVNNMLTITLLMCVGFGNVPPIWLSMLTWTIISDTITLGTLFNRINKK